MDHVQKHNVKLKKQVTNWYLLLKALIGFIFPKYPIFSIPFLTNILLPHWFVMVFFVFFFVLINHYPFWVPVPLSSLFLPTDGSFHPTVSITTVFIITTIATLFSFFMKILMSERIWWLQLLRLCGAFCALLRAYISTRLSVLPPTGTVGAHKLPQLCPPQVSTPLYSSWYAFCPRAGVMGGERTAPAVRDWDSVISNIEGRHEIASHLLMTVSHPPHKDLLCVCVFSSILVDADRILNSSWAPWSWQQTSTDRMNFWPDWKLTSKIKT